MGYDGCVNKFTFQVGRIKVKVTVANYRKRDWKKNEKSVQGYPEAPWSCPWYECI